MHFVVTTDRLAVLVHDLKAAGMDTTPIPGDEDVAWPIVEGRMNDTLASMTTLQRMIALPDVIYSGDADSAQTGSWYDWISPNILKAMGGGMSAVQQFMYITPEGFTGADEGGP